VLYLHSRTETFRMPLALNVRLFARTDSIAAGRLDTVAIPDVHVSAQITGNAHQAHHAGTGTGARHSHRRVEHDQEPRRRLPVQVVGHVILEPAVLIAADAEGLVVAQRDDVDEAHVEGAADTNACQESIETLSEM